MKRVLTILFIFLISSLQAQTTWEALPSHPDGSGFTGLVVSQNGDLFAATGSYSYPSTIGGISRSTDGGTSWDKVFPAYIARTIEITTDGTLFASIWDYPNSNEGIYRSTDNGSTWQPMYITTNSNEHFFSIKDAGSGVMYAGARYGVLASFDGGSTWGYDASFPVGETWVWDVEAAGGTIFAASAAGTYSKSLLNWDLMQGVSAGDTVICLTPPINSTSNGGSTLTNLIFGGSQKGRIYSAIVYPLANFAIVYASLVYKVFALFNLNNSIIFASRALKSAADGLDGDTTGTGIMISYDGVNWIYDSDGLPSDATIDVFASNNTLRGSMTVYAGAFQNSSDGAKIYKKEYTIATNVKNEKAAVPEYTLSQNYPNPFNPTTEINFRLPRQSFVNLEIYNMLGEKVSTLVSKYLSPGNYNIEWNAADFPSGVYFYRIKADNFNLVKKMLLLR